MRFLMFFLFLLSVMIPCGAVAKEDPIAFNKMVDMPLSEALVTLSSPFGPIYVVESKPYRALIAAEPGYFQTVINMEDASELPLEYARLMMLSVLYPEAVRNVLVVGLGGGQISTYLGLYLKNTQIVSVDINPVIVDVAQKYLGYVPGALQRVVVADALHVLQTPSVFGVPKQYDIIFMDAFLPEDVPAALQGLSFWRLIKSRLSPGGVMVQNMIFKPETLIPELRAVFDHVDLYDGEPQFVVMAYDGPKKDLKTLMARAQASQQTLNWSYSLPRLLEVGGQLNEEQQAVVAQLEKVSKGGNDL